MKLFWTRKLRVEISGLTDVGLVRKLNEDYVLTASGDDAPPWVLGLASVFDGVGGLPRGEVASSRAARYLQEELRSMQPPANADALREAIYKAILSVHEHLLEDGQRDPELRGMATTATIAIVARRFPSVLVIGHVGDGSAFLVCGQKIERLTPTDALPVGPARWETAIPEFNTLNVNKISQALGHRMVVPHTNTYPIQRGDFVILGTDGLVGEIGTDKILSATTGTDPRIVCKFLVDAANEAGGTDNIGVAVIRFM